MRGSQVEICHVDEVTAHGLYFQKVGKVHTYEFTHRFTRLAEKHWGSRKLTHEADSEGQKLSCTGRGWSTLRQMGKIVYCNLLTGLVLARVTGASAP